MDQSLCIMASRYLLDDIEEAVMDDSLDEAIDILMGDDYVTEDEEDV